ncbi:MAG: DUF2062 domain-containing protein [Proteobacteria bacterium]|nr:DUF2062 domain-containing protein [Pseudomonadota bacterium]
MTGNLKILIVMPVFNDGNTLRSVAQSAIATGYDLLVVDDGSVDHCIQSVADLQCRTMRLLKHVGKGAALLQGAAEAAKHGYDTIVSIDGDGLHNPTDIDLLVAKAQVAENPCMIIGARQGIRDSNHFIKSSANFWVRLACGLEIPDAESNFRLYPVKELLAQNLNRSHYGFEIETIVKLAWSGIQVSSVPVTGCNAPAASEISLYNTIRKTLSLTLLHSRLVARRLSPWPHKKLTEDEPFPEKVYKSISKNPLKVLKEICREHTSPLWLATAVWLGIFMGALPLLAIHTIAIIYVAHRLHMNKVAAVAASQFCMPPVVPVLCIQMGYYLRNGELLVDFSWQPWLLGIHERLWEWFIGSLLVGPLLGLIGAGIMYFVASHVQKGKLKNID